MAETINTAATINTAETIHTAATIITVEGHFDYHHPAERGTVHLSAGFEGPERASVVSYTTELSARLSEQATELEASGAVTWWSTDRMRVWSDRPWNSEGAILPFVHHAAVALEVKFADFRALADWVESSAVQGGVTVSGLEWTLTEVTRARITAEAQHGAVRDAVDRATAYAASLGLGTVRALAVADPGMLGDGSSPGALHEVEVMSRLALGGPPSDEGLDFKPEDITVTARVHARFAAS